MHRFLNQKASLVQRLTGSHRIVRVAFVRHCETPLNAAGVVDGASSSQLTAKGMLQAEALFRYFHVAQPHWLQVRWLASPLDRAVATARAILPDSAFEIADGFREVDVGAMQGRSWSEGVSEGILPPDHDVATAFPGGESFVGAQSRALAELGRHLANEQRDLVIVAHGGIIALTIIGIFQMPADVFPFTVLDNGSCSVVEFHCFGAAVSPKIKQLNFVPSIEPRTAGF